MTNTIKTPNDHQSHTCVWPLRLTTSGAFSKNPNSNLIFANLIQSSSIYFTIYSTVPQKLYVLSSSLNIDSLLRPKSVRAM